MCLYQSFPVLSSDPLYPPFSSVSLAFILQRGPTLRHTQTAITHTHKDFGIFNCSSAPGTSLQRIFALYKPTRFSKTCLSGLIKAPVYSFHSFCSKQGRKCVIKKARRKEQGALQSLRDNSKLTQHVA